MSWSQATSFQELPSSVTVGKSATILSAKPSYGSRGAHHASGHRADILVGEELIDVSSLVRVPHQATLQHMQHIPLADCWKFNFPSHDGIDLRCKAGDVAERQVPVSDLIQDATKGPDI